MKIKTIVFAPHDDGSGAFAVLYRLARAMVNYADNRGIQLSLFFLNSSEAQYGQEQLNRLVEGTDLNHEAWSIPTDNLIRLPKNPDKAAIDGEKIPGILHKRVQPLWYGWPNLDLTEDWWRNVSLGISMGVPQLHRFGLKFGFSSSRWETGSFRWD